MLRGNAFYISLNIVPSGFEMLNWSQSAVRRCMINDVCLSCANRKYTYFFRGRLTTSAGNLY